MWVRGLAFALIAIGAALRLWNATRELSELLKTTIPDDAFYYFGIARHLSLAHPPSIDGVHATNGYHPLWLAMLVPVWKLVGSSDAQAPVHVALVLGALFDVGASAVLYRVCRQLGLGGLASCAALFVFVINPWQVVNATSGLETPVALFFGLLLVSVSLSPRALERPVLLGGLSALALLSRTDQLFLVAAVVGVLARSEWQAKGAAAGRRWFAKVVGVTAVGLLPWFGWSLATTGTLVQSSAVALSYLHRNIPRTWGYAQEPLAMKLDRALASMREAGALLTELFGMTGVGLGVLLGLLAMVVLRSRVHEPTRRAAPLLVSTAVLFFAHTLGRGVFREWYSAPFLTAFCLVLALVTDFLLRELASPRPMAVVLGLTLATYTGLNWGHWEGARYVQQLAGQPGNPHEGHTDCGVVSYFTGEGVTNLDGIVNQQALEAMLGGRLLEYIEHEQFNRLYLTSHYQSSFFLGPRAWERLVRLDGQALRPATEDEKNRRIGPTTRELPFTWDGAGEHLGDGWSCCEWPPAPSVGPSSELLVYLPEPSPDARLGLRLSAVVTNDGGVQPVDVFLGDQVLSRLDVAPQERIFSIPLEKAAAGRNRLLLKYGAPASLPPDRGRLSWWRSDWGQPMRAIRAHGLWLHAPVRLGTVELSASDARLECEGCYGVERSGAVEWRWTNGRAKAQLTVEGARGTRCRVELDVGGRPLAEVRWNGGAQGATTAFDVELDGRATHALELDSDTFHAPGDDRTLGVMLRRVVMRCQ